VRVISIAFALAATFGLAVDRSTGAAGRPQVVDAVCAGTAVASVAGPVADTELTEISGIDHGVASPRTLWVHNDSGDSARVFAVMPSGRTRATVELAGAIAFDWEEIAVGVGPAPGVSYLYVADIGDNLLIRPEVAVHRAPEPPAGAQGRIALEGAVALRLRYPDGPRDAEALLVDPVRRQLLIVEKIASGGPAGVYSAPLRLPTRRVTTMRRVTEIRLPAGSRNRVTGADISADGTQIAVRTTGAVLLWKRDPAKSAWSALMASPCLGPVPAEQQGEAIAFAGDGRSYTTVSEGLGQPIHVVSAGR